MKKYIYAVILFSSLFILSCRKSYFDINKNPNQATEGSITPDLILPLAQHDMGVRISVTYAPVARWMGMWSRGGDFGPNGEEESYRITANFGGGQWNGWYNNLNDLDILEKKSKAAGQNFYQGIAKTLKTVGFSNLVDLYNNVPYTKAFDLNSNILPTYDKGPAIYKDLFNQLDQALVLINSASGNDLNLSSADIMFKGDAAKWRKYINTLRLKYVLKLINTTVVVSATELAKVTADGYIGVGETASVNPGYTKANNTAGTSQQSPYWDSYKENVSGVRFDNFNRANKFALDLYRNNSDNRFMFVYSAAQTPLNGNLYVGYPYGYASVAGLTPSISSSDVAGPGLARSPSQNQWVLTSVESLFLQAEAAQRFAPTTAKLAFENAIRESFNWLGVPNATATANAYIATNNIYVDYTASTNKLKTILSQKYLSLIGINNVEAWNDYRRVGATDYLDITPAKTQFLGAAANIPNRYRYPQVEYNFNAANVGAEGDPDPQIAKIFWAK